MTDKTKAVALYLRVSSEEQRENQTIKTQEEALEGYLQLFPEVRAFDWYRDDGVSGTIPMSERPAGRRLFADAAAGLFQEVWVYKIDRLGRDDIDPLLVWRDLERLGVTVRSIMEGVSTIFEYHIRVAMAAEERRSFLARSSAGLDRAAREGRYCGGIVPLGYKAQGTKKDARLVPNDAMIGDQWTEAELVYQIYHWLATEHWTCVRIADHLNALGVPTSYQKDGRLLKDESGKRTKRTQGKWRAGRIRNLVVNPVYKGRYHYGRRANRKREVIVADVPPLVSEEMWGAAQDALRANRLMTKNPGRVYILRSLIRCGTCGLTYQGTPGRDGIAWYRCGGQVIRGARDHRCQGKSIRGDWIEPIILDDVRRWLENPGDVLEELQEEQRHTSGAAVAEAERAVIEKRLAGLPGERDRLLEVYKRDLIDLDKLGEEFAKIKAEERVLTARLTELSPKEDADEPLGEDVLAEIRRRLNEGLCPVTWREVLSLLVRRIEVRTEVTDDRTKKVTIIIQYRFSAVVSDARGRGSWPPPA
jgi:site-specific DNA recombinase